MPQNIIINKYTFKVLLYQQSEIEIYKPFYMTTLAKNLVIEIHNVENQGTTSRQL